MHEVTGSTVNCGVGLGLEVPCFYHFDGHQNFNKEAARRTEGVKESKIH